MEEEIGDCTGWVRREGEALGIMIISLQRRNERTKGYGPGMMDVAVMAGFCRTQR